MSLSFWLLLACLLRAEAAGPPLLGEGAKRLTLGALALAQERFDGSSCLSGIAITANQFRQAIGPGAVSGRLNEFQFHFYSPNKLLETYRVGIVEAVDREVVDPLGTPIIYNRYTDSRGSRVSNIQDPWCITELSVDSGRALAIGLKSGLPPGASYELSLRRALNEASPYWPQPKLRRKTFWFMRPGILDGTLSSRDTPLFEIFVDAGSGALLRKREIITAKD